MSEFFDENEEFLGIGFAIPDDYSIVDLGYEDDVREVVFGDDHE